jgi:hypothetical protein
MIDICWDSDKLAQALYSNASAPPGGYDAESERRFLWTG